MSTSKKTMRGALVFTVLGVAGVFLPSILGIDGFDGGFAISMISGFVALTALITALVFWRMSVNEKAIEQGENQLAHWTYSDEEWAKFTVIEHETNKKEKKMMFYIVTGFAVFFGVLFLIIDPESGKFVALAMVGLIVLIAFVAWYSIWSAHRRNLKQKGEVFISPMGVIMNGQFHAWNMMGARLEGVTLITDVAPKCLEFTYSQRGKNGRQNTSVRVPVPAAEEHHVDELVKKLEESVQK